MNDSPSLHAAGLQSASTEPRSAQRFGGSWPGSSATDELERERLLGAARESDAGRQLARSLARWTRALEHLRLPALRRLADNRPVDPNDAGAWRSRDEHAQAVLRRPGITNDPAS